MKAWQVPLRDQLPGPRLKVAHWFDRSGKKNQLVKTTCGQLVNPGFAKPASAKSRNCVTCVKALARQGGVAEPRP
jgi:hypothetical protein